MRTYVYAVCKTDKEEFIANFDRIKAIDEKKEFKVENICYLCNVRTMWVCEDYQEAREDVKKKNQEYKYDYWFVLPIDWYPSKNR